MKLELKLVGMTLLNSVKRRFEPYRKMYRAFQLIDPSLYLPQNMSRDTIDEVELLAHAWRLDSPLLWEQLLDFRRTFLPPAVCEPDEHSELRPCDEKLIGEDLSKWYQKRHEDCEGQWEQEEGGYPVYLQFVRV